MIFRKIARVKNAKSRRRPVLLGVIAGLVLAGGIGTAAYASYFNDRALPGVSVLGESVTGRDRAELATSLQQRADDVTVAVTVDGKTTSYGLDELGAKVDVDTTLNQIFAANNGLGSKLNALIKPSDIALATSFDDATTQIVVQSLTAASHIPATEATFAFDEESQSFKLVPGQAGAAINPDPLLAALQTAATTLESQSLSLSAEQVAPKITDDNAQAAADTANQLIGVDVTVTGRKGDSFTASPADKAAWVTIPNAESAEFVPTLDGTKVKEWVTAQATNANIETVTGVRKVNESGKEVAVATEAVDGWTVNNTDAITEAITNSLNGHQAYAGEFTFDQTKAEWTEQKIASGTENLAYQAAPGEKWVDVDLGNNSVTAYEGGKAVLGPVGIVPGRPGLETPTGTYKVYLKYDVQTMRGLNPDGTRYVAPNVQYVSYFTGDIAFHAAPWQPSFGWSGPGGSHGCVNMSTSDAKFIFDWAGVGTTVVSHY